MVPVLMHLRNDDAIKYMSIQGQLYGGYFTLFCQIYQDQSHLRQNPLPF